MPSTRWQLSSCTVQTPRVFTPHSTKFRSKRQESIGGLEIMAVSGKKKGKSPAALRQAQGGICLMLLRIHLMQKMLKGFVFVHQEADECCTCPGLLQRSPPTLPSCLAPAHWHTQPPLHAAHVPLPLIPRRLQPKTLSFLTCQHTKLVMHLLELCCAANERCSC